MNDEHYIYFSNIIPVHSSSPLQSRSESQRKHPCLTSFDRLPQTEKQYNVNLSIDTMKTIEALGYHLIVDTPPCRLRPVRLAQKYVSRVSFHDCSEKEN